jgi:hypothetical protein
MHDSPSNFFGLFDPYKDEKMNSALPKFRRLFKSLITKFGWFILIPSALKFVSLSE